MSAARCRVAGKFVAGIQYYQRDVETKIDDHWTAVPTFVADPKLAHVMTEDYALIFLKRLRSLDSRKEFWIEDISKNGKRIDYRSDEPRQTEDGRAPVIATLDADTQDPNAKLYIVKPANTVNGPKWFLRLEHVPSVGATVVWADTPLDVLQKASDAGILKFAEQYIRPAPAPKPVLVQEVAQVRPDDRW